MNWFFDIKRLAAGGLAIALATTPAIAQENRFVMLPSDDGFVRLDTFTGEMSACSKAEGQIVCRMAADERQALEQEIDLLEERIAALEEALEDNAGRSRNGFPSDEEIDRTFGVMEKLMRRFLGMIEDFEKENKEMETEKAVPDKT